MDLPRAMARTPGLTERAVRQPAPKPFPLHHTPPSIITVLLRLPPSHIFLILQAIDQSHDRHHQKQQHNEALESKLLHVTLPSASTMPLIRSTSRMSWAIARSCT